MKPRLGGTFRLPESEAKVNATAMLEENQQ
jgi:hypothetical protein